MTAQKQRSIQPVVRKIPLNGKPDDVTYWRSQPYSARLQMLEQIRSEYHQWKFNAEQCFEARLAVDMEGVMVNFIDLENLLKNKRSSGRAQDLVDLENPT